MNSANLAIVYARVSDDPRDANRSLPSQIEGAKEYARRNGMRVVGVYSELITGTVYPRPKLEEALAVLESGGASVLIVHTEDRLNRHDINGFLIRDRIQRAGAELHYTLSGKCNLDDEHRMFSMIKDAIAANEVRTITERMQRGKRQKAKAGAWIGLGKPPYGYRVVGEGNDMRLEIVEEEARVIRQIFAWYVHDKIGALKITERLCDAEIPRPGASRALTKPKTTKTQWHYGTVYRILGNETYIGTHYAFRWKYTEGRARVERPREDWVEIRVPPIVEETTFAAAQLRLSNGRNDYYRHRQYEYLMATRLTCGVCGYKLSTMPANHGKNMYYRCYAYKDRRVGAKCTLPVFSVQQVDSAIWEHVKKMMRDPDGFRHAVEEARERSRQDHSHLYESIAAVEKEIARQEIRLAQAVELFLDNQEEEKRFVREATKRSQDEANELLTRLHRQRDEYSRQVIEIQISDETLVAVEDYAAELKDDLEGMSTAEQRGVIDALGATATLAYEDGRKVAYLTVLLQKTRIDIEADSQNYLFSQSKLKIPQLIPLTFRLVLAA